MGQIKKLNELMIENQEFQDKELEDLLDLRNEILEITEEFEKLYTTYDVIDEGLIKRLNLQKNKKSKLQRWQNNLS